MEKLGLISILLSVLLILTSCMKVTMSLEVGKDGNLVQVRIAPFPAEPAC